MYVKPHLLEWREVPVPVLHSGTDALVRPIAASTCDLDSRIVDGSTPMPAPFAIGHEAVGEITDVGDEAAAAGLRPGMRVVIPWHLSCGQCETCRAGLPANCTSTPHLAAFGTPLGGHHGGFFDDLVRVPYAAHNLVNLPDGVAPATAASCSDNIVDAFGAVAPHLRAQPGADVLVVGGPGRAIGPLAAMFAAALTTGEVIYLDKDPDGVALAAQLGATRTLCQDIPQRMEDRYPLTVNTAADPAGLACALRSTAPGGVCSSRSIYFTDVPLPYFDLYSGAITLTTGLPQITPHLPKVLDLIAAGTVDPDPVYSQRLDFDDAAEEIPQLRRKGVFLRSTH
ncbi:zinc-dependent alcohol dehydrogenase [Streptomyces chartreusis]